MSSDKPKRPFLRRPGVDLTGSLGGNDNNGVSSLASVTSPELERPHADPDSILLHVNQVEPDPDQPRKNFDDEYIQQLAASIDADGQAMAIVVEALGGGRYKIVDGECRWRAISQYCARSKQIRATLKKYDASDARREVLQISANEQRENYTKLELAQAYQRLHERYGWNDAEIARQVNKPRQYVSAVKSVLKAPTEVQDALQAGRVSWRDWVRNPDEVMKDYKAGLYNAGAADTGAKPEEGRAPKKKSKNTEEAEPNVSLPLSAARGVMQLLVELGAKHKLEIEPPKDATRKQIGEFIAKNIRKVRKAI
jgi:ParB/RepB/Spo0J family partition protein